MFDKSQSPYQEQLFDKAESRPPDEDDDPAYRLYELGIETAHRARQYHKPEPLAETSSNVEPPELQQTPAEYLKSPNALDIAREISLYAGEKNLTSLNALHASISGLVAKGKITWPEFHKLQNMIEAAANDLKKIA